ALAAAPRARQSRSLRRREARAIEELGPALGGATDGLGPAPPRNRRMVAREQYRRHAASLVVHGPRVLRALEPPVGVGLVGEPFRLDHVRDEPRNRVDHDHRGELATGEYEVPYRELLVHLLLHHPFIDAFVVP